MPETIPLTQLSPRAQALAKALRGDAVALAFVALDDHGQDIVKMSLVDVYDSNVTTLPGVFFSEEHALESAELALAAAAKEGVDTMDKLVSQYRRRVTEDELMAQRLAAAIRTYKTRVDGLTVESQKLHDALAVK